ncbi:MAG: cbb3-type cytochrome c oxidase subunit I, partial [Acidimicrobiales bacterium]
AAYAVDGGPFGPENEGVALFLAALVALLAALSVATISVVTTVIALRAPGMSLRRTPLFSWSMLIAGPVWLLTLAVLAGVQLLVYVDFTYGQQFLGGSAGIYERIRWVFWQPTLYAFAIPALGIIADVVPTFAQVRHKQHRTAMVLIGLFGALSFGAWAQAGATVGDAPIGDMPWLYDGTWIAASVIVLVPLLGLFGLWTGTLASGRPRLASPLILAQVAGLLLLVGVAAGLGTMVEDFELAFTTWSTGQAHLVVIGTIVAGLAGVVFWAPKIYGSLLPEGVGRLVAPLVLLGALALAVPYGIAGMLDQPAFATPAAVTVDDEAVEAIDPAETVAQTAGLDDVDTIEGLNLVAAIGGVAVVAAGLLFALGVLRMGQSRGRAAVDDDPWDGHTLEWATSSPPPVGNFATLPEITSEAPVYDARHRAATATTEGAS